jgi:AraC-like DNA-binding protein
MRTAIRKGLPRRGVRVVTCRDLAGVERHLERSLVDAVVLNPRNGELERAFELVARFPGIPFFALGAFRPEDADLVATCRDAGIAESIVEGVDDPAAGELIAARTASRRRRAALAQAPQQLRLTEPLQLRAWEEVLLRAGTATTTADVARSLRRTREHLSREFGAGGAPNLKRVIDLVRVAWAADLLGNPGYSAAVAARILGFSSGSHLAECARRVAGTPPAGLAELGPRGVLARFRLGRMRSRI